MANGVGLVLQSTVVLFVFNLKNTLSFIVLVYQMLNYVCLDASMPQHVLI